MKLGRSRFMLTLPEGLKARIQKEADKRALPLSSLIRLALFEWLESKDKGQDNKRGV